jgi:putative phosphoesterase
VKIGVIADTHIPSQASQIPQKVLDDFKDADMIIHAGDLVSLAVLEKLKSICPDVRAVWGNMDPLEVRKKLSEKEIIEAGKYKIGLTHGYGAPNNLIPVLTQYFKDYKVDIIIFGHAHSSCNEKKGNILYFNPGSPTDKIFAPYNSYGIIEIGDKIEARIVKL